MNTHAARTVHLIDIENLTGRPRPARQSVAELRLVYERVAHIGEDDHVIIACNHGACIEVGLGWPQARLIAKSGRDGADKALLEVIRSEHLVERFERVCIASGDGIFADAAARIASLGARLTVVARDRSLSLRLRLAVKDVVTFSWPNLDQEAA